MTVPTNTFLTYDAIGNREDLVDVIYNVDPSDTIFMSTIAQVGASATLHEWQTDEYRAAADNVHLSGDDATTTESTPTVRLTNNCQISTVVPRVSGTQRAIDSAGRADEFAYQRVKHGIELRRDMELALLANNAKVAGDESTPRELAGIESWIASNTDFNATGGADPAGDGSDARTDGTQRAYTEDQLKGVLQLCWDAGGEPETILTGSFNKQAMSAFTGNVTRNVDAVQETLNTAISVYVSDFGTLKIELSRFMRARTVLVLQMNMWATAFLHGRNMTEKELAVTGDSDRVLTLSEFTMESRNEKASGGIFDLLTS